MAKVTKAELIREYLPRHPDMGATELARLISSENPKLEKPVTPQEVSTMRNKLKLKQNGHPTVKAESAPTDLANVVEHLKKAVDSVGKDQARRILDIL